MDNIMGASVISKMMVELDFKEDSTEHEPLIRKKPE